MFIEEQKAQFHELQLTIRDEHEFVERHVWSPVSCRFTSWTFKPLVRHDERGNMVKGSRQRCPFVKVGV